MEELGRLLVDRVRCRFGRKGEAGRRRLPFLNVSVLEDLLTRIERPARRRYRSVCHDADVEVDVLQDRVSINGQGNRLALCGVVEGRGSRIQLETVESDRGRVTVGQACVRLDPRYVLSPDRARDIYVTSLQRGDDGVDVRNGTVRDAVEVGKPRPPIAWILLQGQVIVALPLDELERTTASSHWSEREVGPALGHGIERDHHAGTVDQCGEQRCIGLAQVEDDVGVVDDLDALHAGQIGLTARVGGRLVAVDVGFYRRPVERRTVLILDPRLQRELVVERVRHIPGLDQPRLDLQGRVDGEERVIDVVKDLAFDQKRGVEGIEGVQLAFESDRRGAAALGRARAGGGPSARAATGGKQQQPYEGKCDSSHLRLLPTARIKRPGCHKLGVASTAGVNLRTRRYLPIRSGRRPEPRANRPAWVRGG